MHIVPANQTTFAFRPDADPVLHVRPGEVVRFETSPEPVERLFAAGSGWTEAVEVRAINAVTGPVFIEDVAPGDAVSVEVLAIEPRDWAWNAAIPEFGLLDGLLPEPMQERLPIHGGEVIVSQRVLIPAQVAGGLFSLGDLHAAMGEHEATFVAIECAGAAIVRLDVRPGMNLESPRIETADRTFVMGLSACGDYGAARLQAARLLYEFLTEEAAFTRREAYIFISARGDLTLGGPAGTIILGSVPRVMGDRC